MLSKYNLILKQPSSMEVTLVINWKDNMLNIEIPKYIEIELGKAIYNLLIYLENEIHRESEKTS